MGEGLPQARLRYMENGKMAIGINYESAGGDYLPIVKYDARAGRVFRRDRANGENTDSDITRTFKAVFDFENIETGYIDFDTGGAPSYSMTRLSSSERPDRPSEKHRPGIRLIVKLHKDCGGDIREISSTAKAFLKGIDEAHNLYLAGVSANEGKLPVFVLKDTIGVTTGEGARKSTNYVPVFDIVGWVKRPDDLVYKGRGSAAPAKQEAAPLSSPPSTGSTKAAPPAPADDADFG
jgi:hypothetical protein